MLLLYPVVALATTTYLYPSMKSLAFLVCGVSAFALGAYSVRATRTWRWLVGTMVASALLVALYGLYLYLPHLGGISVEHKLASTFGLHNSAAGFFLLTWPLAFALIEFRRGLTFALSGLVLILALLLTFSRAGYIALALQLLCLGIAWLLIRRAAREHVAPASRRARAGWLFTSISVLVILVIALAYGGFFSSVGERVASIFNAADYSLGGRLTFWLAALEMFARFPVFGVGLGNFGFHFTYLQPNWYYYSTDAHGLVFKFLAEGGLIGLAFLGGLGWFFLRGARGSTRSNGLLSGWPRVFLITGLLGFFLHSLVDFDWTYLANVAFFAVLAGVVVGTKRPQEESVRASWPTPQRSSVAVKVVTVLIALGLLAQVLVGAALCCERFWLDRARDTAAVEALKRAIAVMPINASTRIDLALVYVSEHPPAFEPAGNELRAALSLNAYESQAYFLLSQIPDSRLEERIRLAERAMKLDPYNRPLYYLGLSRLYRAAGDEDAERSILTLADHRFAITEPITPDFPRPLWVQYNLTFATMYDRLADLYAERDAELSELYAEISARFGGVP